MSVATKDLPERVCVLDLETSRLVKGDLVKTPLAFVGIMVYELRDGSYLQGSHQCFFPDELSKLEIFLRGFRGLMLGHNILNFDYEILRSSISFEGVEAKTVDTLGFLYEKRATEPVFGGGTESTLKGLSLDNLAQRNLDQSKGMGGRSVPKLWREGRREEVIDYNKKDLILTFSLWQWMVERRTVVLGEREEFGLFVPATEGDHVYEPWRIEIFPDDLPRLTGQAPLYNTRLVWITDGPLLEEPPPDSEDEPNYWYRNAPARHYLREDVLMISDQRMDLFGECYEAGPYPADWFTLLVMHEGPAFPARNEEPIDLDEL